MVFQVIKVCWVLYMYFVGKSQRVVLNTICNIKSLNIEE